MLPYDYVDYQWTKRDRFLFLMVTLHRWAVKILIKVYFVQFVGIEGVVTAIVDLFPHYFRRGYRKELFTAFVCIIWFVIGLSMVTEVTPQLVSLWFLLRKFAFFYAFLSRSSERIPILVFLWFKAINFRGIVDDCRLAAPTDFIRGILAWKLDSFRLDFFSVIDKRGSVINDHL